MKISVVIPVYNEPKVIKNCLKSILNQDYKKEDYEIIVVNDGSTDNTLKVVKKYPVKIINLKKNQGRIIAREEGVKAAKYRLILLIDSRLVLERDLLSSLKKIKYEPLIGNILWKPPKNKINLVLTFVKKKIFGGYYTGNFKPTFIKKSNFDQIPKGAAIFFCDKKLFLDSQPKGLAAKNKNASDDTKLFWNIVFKKPILKHPLPCGWRVFREDQNAVVNHLFNRGPKFVDYYFKPGKRFYPFFWLLFAFIAINIALILKPIYYLYELAILASLLVIAAIFLASNLYELLITLVYLPQAGIIFLSGIIKGIFIKILNKK